MLVSISMCGVDRLAKMVRFPLLPLQKEFLLCMPHFLTVTSKNPRPYGQGFVVFLRFPPSRE